MHTYTCHAYIARAGRGTSAFAQSTERLEVKVLHQLKCAAQPALTDIKITWDGIIPVLSFLFFCPYFKLAVLVCVFWNKFLCLRTEITF